MSEEIALREAFASEALHENLMSVNQLANDGFDTLFIKDDVFIGKDFHVPEQYQVKGQRKRGAYYVTLTTQPSPISQANRFELLDEDSTHTNSFLGQEYIAPPMNSMDIAHYRLNHLHEEGIRKLVNNSSLSNLIVNLDDKLNPCIGCLQGKARKGTPPTSTTKSTAIGDLIHMDLCGPIAPVSAAGNRHVLTATEDFSGYLHTWPLRTKGAAYDVIAKFVNTFQNHHGSVKRVRTDRGGEFTSENLRELYGNLGIEQQLTIRHSSHQNPISERANLTVFNDIRACHVSSGIDWQYWDETLSSVTRTRNFSPKLRLQWQIPHSIWTKEKPDFNHLLVFGETCFVIAQAVDKLKLGSSKLAPRAIQGRFVGYTTNSKGYRILLADGAVLESTYSNTTTIPSGLSLAIDPSAPTPPHETQPTHISPPTLILNAFPPPLSASSESNSSYDTGDDGDPEGSEASSDVIAEILSDEELPREPIAAVEPVVVPPTVDEQVQLGITPIIGRPGYFQHRTKGIVQVEEKSDPPSASTLNPPARSKRESKMPERYGSSSAMAQSPPVVHHCSRCISGHIAREALIAPAASAFMHLASVQWYKQSTPSRSSRAAQPDNTPKTHADIEGRDDADGWYLAEDEEIAQIIAMGSWELVPLPKGRKAIKSKWVYRIKTDANGNVTRYKARLCACGYSQQAGVDYKDIYSPVFRMESSRLFLATIASRGMNFIQMDVTGAFLNGPLEETIFMRQPEGFVDSSRADYVLLLLKNLYGLKQAPRVWHQTIDPFLCSLGFSPMEADPCIYYQWDSSHTNLQLVSLYVDNLGIAGDLAADVESVRSQLHAKFKMTDEPDDQFLKMKMVRDGHAFLLSQPQAIDALLKTTGMREAHSVSTPMETLCVSKDDCPVVGSEHWQHMQSVPYRETVGSLTHICRSTRPDIAYPVSVASRYLSNPGPAHWNMVKRILRYLKETRDWTLRIDPGPTLTSTLQENSQNSPIHGPLRFHGFSDADWGGELETSKSTSGYGFFLGNSLVSWQSKTQATTATSTTYAEYIASYHAAAECIWSRSFLSELGLLPPGPTTLYGDNEAALKLAQFHMITPRSKHFDTKFHYIREQVHKKTIQIVHCPGEENIADIWTKPLGKERFMKFRSRLGVFPPLTRTTQLPSPQRVELARAIL